MYGGPSTVCHDGRVMFPLEFVMDEDAKVSDDVRAVNAIITESV